MQLLAAAVLVLVLALAGGGRYPLYVDLAVYAACAAMAATGVGQLDAAYRKRRHPGDVPEEVTFADALREAADWVITARPADDFHGLTLTAAMVQREAFMRSGLEVPYADAALVLTERLRFRGYGLPPGLQHPAPGPTGPDREDPR
ncbi:hypothetical protein [Streptomyces sp. NPDC101249]|uniref:hypothetical protein n=1 Tax=Streptomyces sp. NPDC101249 TaxID=3366140 RepID=UPI003823DE7C